jgi:hypothetical protein
MKFFPVLFWNGVWRCLNFVKQATRVLCFSCILLIAPLRTQGGKISIDMEQVKEMLKDSIGRFLSNERMTYEELYGILSELKTYFTLPIFNEDFLSSLGITNTDYLKIKGAIDRALGYKKMINKNTIKDLYDLSEILNHVYENL